MMKKTIGLYKFNPNQKLGQGILGKTVKATHEVNNSIIVLKIINKNQNTQNKHTKENLKQQIKYYSKISGQNIANYLDIVQTEHHFYIQRQFCPDGSLRDLIKNKKTFNEQQVINFIVQIAKGMYELIQKGIMHHNLIPQNILFSNNILKISDFGCSKIKKQILQYKNIKTRFQYKSPQHLAGLKGNFKSDVWSLGIMVYQLLYGKYPWDCSSQQKLQQQIQKQKIKFHPEVQISLGMKKFLMSCLMYDINQRAEWKDILQSNFLHQFNLPKFHNFNQKYTHILSSLRSSVLQNNLDIQRYFKSKHLSANDQLTKKAFQLLVEPMDPYITKEEIQFLFASLDKNGDNVLHVSQFQQAMSQFQIPLQGAYRRTGQKLLKDQNIDKQLAQKQKIEKQLSVIYKGLIDNLQKRQIYDLYEVFTQSDKKRVGALQFDQFVSMLRQIDKTITKTECQKIFKAFDKNQDNKISFKQFFGSMCKITGSPNGFSKY